MTLASHAAYLAKITDEVLPRLEAALPVARTRLIAELTGRLDEMGSRIKSDLRMMMSLCGRPLSDAQASKLSSLMTRTQEMRVEELRAFTKKLIDRKSGCVAEFVSALLDDVRGALTLLDAIKDGKAEAVPSNDVTDGIQDVANEIGLSREHVLTLARGDSAFRTLSQFLERANDVLDRVQPRSMLAVRSSRAIGGASPPARAGRGPEPVPSG